MAERLILEMVDPDGKKLELYTNDAVAPEIYVDGAWGFKTNQSICKINLFTTSLNFEPGLERRELVTRLVMPLPALFAFRDFIVNQCKRLEPSMVTPEQIENMTREQLVALFKPEPLAQIEQKPKSKKRKAPTKRKAPARKPKAPIKNKIGPKT